MRKDRFPNSIKLITSEIPNSKDIAANVFKRPPIHLNKKWFYPKKRRLKSEIKILKDNLFFFISLSGIKYMIIKFLRFNKYLLNQIVKMIKG